MNSPPRVIRRTAREAPSPLGLNELNLHPNTLWPDTRSSRKVLKPKPKKKTKGGRKKRTRRRKKRTSRRKKRTRQQSGGGISQSKPQEETPHEKVLQQQDKIFEEREKNVQCMKRFINSASAAEIAKMENILQRLGNKDAYQFMNKWCKENPTNPMNIGGRRTRRKNRRKKRTRRRRRKKRTRRRKGRGKPPAHVGPYVKANDPSLLKKKAYLARLQLAAQNAQEEQRGYNANNQLNSDNSGGYTAGEKYMNELLEFDD